VIHSPGPFGCTLVAGGCTLVARGCTLVTRGCTLAARGCVLVAGGCILAAGGCILVTAGCALVAACKVVNIVNVTCVISQSKCRCSYTYLRNAMLLIGHLFEFRFAYYCPCSHDVLCMKQVKTYVELC
jgi:hypothetical protein